MASLILRLGLKASASINVSAVSTGPLSHSGRSFTTGPLSHFGRSFTTGQLSHSGSSDDAFEDAIIRASIDRSKYPFDTDVKFGRYDYHLRNFLLRMEREQAENGVFLGGKEYPLMPEFIDPTLYSHPIPPVVRDINRYLLNVHCYETVHYVTRTHVGISTPSSAMLASDYQLLKVLSKEIVVGGTEAADEAYAASPSECDRLIKGRCVRLMLTERISPNRGKDQEARVLAKVSGIGTLNAEKMVSFFKLFVMPLKTTVAVRWLLYKGEEEVSSLQELLGY